MNNKEYVKDCRTMRQKFEDFKWSAKAKLQDGLEWIVVNKEIVILLAPVVIKGVAVVTKAAIKHNNLSKEQDLKDLYCYDRSLGHYWRLKRELTNKEWLEIDQRKAAGERLADILDDLKVLK